nr:MAG TPA: hypothetical protein [Inoviridae sp.]
MCWQPFRRNPYNSGLHPGRCQNHTNRADNYIPMARSTSGIMQ